MFRALVLEEAGGAIASSIKELDESALPAGNVTVAIEYTTVNYKDGLVVNGGGGLVKRWPHVPGIDFAGTVEKSEHPAYRPGDKVVLTGWRVGELQWGGCAQKAAVNGDWLVPLPAGLSTRQAMAVGTAGFTAMLAVMALEAQGLAPAAGEVLVTGAAGGVGSVAIAILAARGYQVVASTGRAEHAGVPEGPRGHDGHRPRALRRSREAPARGGTLGGLHRLGRRQYAGAGACPDEVRLLGRGRRARRRREARAHRDALHPAGREPARHRLGDVSGKAAHRGVDASALRPAARAA